MPNMTGPEATQAIRELGYKKPIFGVTGNTLPKDVEDFIKHGADEVISKPLKVNVLRETLSRYKQRLNEA